MMYLLSKVHALIMNAAVEFSIFPNALAYHITPKIPNPIDLFGCGIICLDDITHIVEGIV